MDLGYKFRATGSGGASSRLAPRANEHAAEKRASVARIRGRGVPSARAAFFHAFIYVKFTGGDVQTDIRTFMFPSGSLVMTSVITLLSIIRSTFHCFQNVFYWWIKDVAMQLLCHSVYMLGFLLSALFFLFLFNQL